MYSICTDIMYLHYVQCCGDSELVAFTLMYPACNNILLF
uniref:Uncharacterized protein n=1 Tax=Anguilla anguilla TaxID=7936 RepID=A0A0E9PCD2_ANGAN